MRRPASTSASWAAAFITAAGLAGCMNTATYGTGQAPELAIFREVTGGIGFGQSKKPAIEYQPRAPLVMPPSSEVAQLPAPVETASVATTDWPQDPDQTKREKTFYGDNTRDDINQAEAHRLKPLAEIPRVETEAPDLDKASSPYAIVGQNAEREQFSAALKEAKGIHKERRYLTDPPDAYKEPAPTAPTDFKEIDAEKDSGFLTRLFTGGFF